MCLFAHSSSHVYAYTAVCSCCVSVCMCARLRVGLYFEFVPHTGLAWLQADVVATASRTALVDESHT